jgi:hypothetical protein
VSTPTTFPRSPPTLRGGLVLIDPDTAAVLRVITLQYNPDSLSRTLQVQGVGGEGGDHVEALRLKGPPAETIKLEAEVDATDQLEIPGKNPLVGQMGIYPQLAALEAIVYPPSSQVRANQAQANAGVMEIVPALAPMTVFVWSRSRVLPVRITDFSVTEEAFDPNLNPLRAKVSLSMRVLSVNDLGFDNKGASLFMTYHQQIERLARTLPSGGLSALGLKELP